MSDDQTLAGFGSAPWGSSVLGAGDDEPVPDWTPTLPVNLDSSDDGTALPGFGAAPYGLSPAGGSVDEFPPFIGTWAPYVGAELARLDTIEFEVTDDYGLDDTRIRAIFSSGRVEAAYEGGSFTELYKRASGRKRVDNGYRYILRRQGGWPSSEVRIDVVATDIAGNAATSQASF